MTEFLSTAIKAAKLSEEIILKYFDSDLQTELKSDNTPVTLADKQAEAIIKQTILKEFPEHSFLGEESGRQESDSAYCWIVDPIDGTKNFARGIPLYSTEIALMKGDEMLLGVSNMPSLRRLICAEKEQGAFFQDTKLTCSQVGDVAEAGVSFGNLKYFIDQGYAEPLVQLSQSCRAFRGFGDCFPYQLLAEGKLDVAVDVGCSIWDIAACARIMEESGAIVTDITGKPITIHSTSILGATPKLHAQVVHLFNSK